MKPTLFFLTSIVSLAMPMLIAAAPVSPNVIVILADDVGWGDPGSYGATRIKTPNLDSLARGGMRFEDAHASASVCTPTRYSMLTGQYSWRRDAVGLNKGVSSGASPLLIPVESTTMPSIMKRAGYRTALVGKWHLGFGNSKPDYNKELKPGPLEIGFDEFFGLPATNDRIPTVFVRDHKVVGLDPADPIDYTYENPGPGSAMKRLAAGRQRIGWMSGGKSAWWKDEDIADTFTREAVAFIERSKDKPFFLCFTPHDVHAPTIPHPRFVGTSGLSKRADMMHELDWSVGELMKTLDRLKLTENTLIIFSSDNGAYATKEEDHRPNGPFRGVKSQLWEGGHRVPFIASWPGKIPAAVNKDLVCLVDLPATLAAVVGQTPGTEDLPDSFNLLPTMKGGSSPAREHLVLMSGKGDLAFRQGKWKYIPDLADADGWSSWKKKNPAKAARPGLYDLTADPGEKNNLHASHPEVSKRMVKLLEQTKNSPITRPK